MFGDSKEKSKSPFAQVRRRSSTVSKMYKQTDGHFIYSSDASGDVLLHGRARQDARLAWKIHGRNQSAQSSLVFCTINKDRTEK